MLPLLSPDDKFIGKSPAMLRIYDDIVWVGPRNVPVLIIGATGTGKELVARAIHRHSLRAQKELLTMNCAGSTESLLDSELFGHEKGSFTGAHERRIGKLERAHQGTLFLDEIPEMSRAMQAKLLRVLEEKKLERVGGHESVSADFRLIAATNCELRHIATVFRQDLFFRLNGFEIHLPLLRDRPGDIPLLVDHYVAHLCIEEQMPIVTVNPEAMQLLETYAWPGNVRELEHVLLQALLRAHFGELTAGSLPDCVHERAPMRQLASEDAAYADRLLDRFPHATLKGLCLEVQYHLILAALRKAGDDREAVAKHFGICATTLWTKIKKHGLDSPR